MCRAGIERIADLLRLGLFHQLLDQLVVDLLFDKEPAARAAALALVEEQTEVGALHGRVEVGVGEDHIGTLASQLQANAFEIALGGGFTDELPGQVFAGEGNLVDIHVAADGRACGWPVAGNHVDDPIGKTRFLS